MNRRWKKAGLIAKITADVATTALAVAQLIEILSHGHV